MKAKDDMLKDRFSLPRIRQSSAIARGGLTILARTQHLGHPPPMAIVKKLLHTRYRVDDLETSVKFYTEVLGLSETRRHKSPRGSELVFLATPNSDEEIELCSYPSSGGVQVQEDLTHLAFEVESLAEFEKHIQTLGVEYSDGPHMKEAGGGFAFIDAPEGYEIELIEKASDNSGY